MSRRFGPRPARRWPFQPIIDRTGIDDTTALSRRLRVDRATIVRWKREGIPDPASDQAAIALSLHPEQIWPGWSAAEGFGEPSDEELYAQTHNQLI